jgi:transposase InsO family protein
MINQYLHKAEPKADIAELCNWAGLNRSVYYYRSSGGRCGVKPSTYTHKRDGSRVANDEVVEEIKRILSVEFVTYGYDLTTTELKHLGYIINKKKVYRLMDQHNLLLGTRIKTTGKRDFVRFRKITASYPLEYLCMDIKYVWVEGERRHYYLLTVQDIYSRKALDWIFLPSIKKQHVISLFMRIAQGHDVKGVTLRNDNGSQFLAHVVRKYLQSEEIKQEFTHISTPEENGYIEAFHSNLRRDLLSKTEFESYYDAKIQINAYMNHYNQIRRHRAIGKITPNEKWEQGWPLREAIRQQLTAEGEQSRPMDTTEKQTPDPSLALGLDGSIAKAQLCRMADRSQARDLQNHFTNFV